MIKYYVRFKHEKWNGDRITFKYINALAEMLTQLSNTELNRKKRKSVRTFTFKIEED